MVGGGTFGVYPVEYDKNPFEEDKEEEGGFIFE